MRIKPEDVLNIAFSTGLFGYDRREVDGFLDEIAEELRTLEKEKQELLRRLALAKAESEQGRRGGSGREEFPAFPAFKQETPKPLFEEKKEEKAPSRHIHRGNGERNRRSAPAFHRPKPMEEEGAAEEASEKAVAAETVPVDAAPEQVPGDVPDTIAAAGSADEAANGAEPVSAEAPAPEGPVIPAAEAGPEAEKAPVPETPDEPEPEPAPQTTQAVPSAEPAPALGPDTAPHTETAPDVAAPVTPQPQAGPAEAPASEAADASVSAAVSNGTPAPDAPKAEEPVPLLETLKRLGQQAREKDAARGKANGGGNGKN